MNRAVRFDEMQKPALCQYNRVWKHGNKLPGMASEMKGFIHKATYFDVGNVTYSSISVMKIKDNYIHGFALSFISVIDIIMVLCRYKYVYLN